MTVLFLMQMGPAELADNSTNVQGFIVNHAVGVRPGPGQGRTQATRSTSWCHVRPLVSL